VSTLSLRLPESLHKALGELAQQDGVSMNQFITTAVAEKIATLKTIESLRERGARGSRKAFEKVLAKVPDLPPVTGDELTPEQKRPNNRLHRTRVARR
jgi:HicB-like protein involved in pilus formation